ncbi:MAG: tetratricopeptide repeat protein [Candidatus Hydrogenedentes bacterium]|nr:tetratricopeptide repeat protein [Candidatus Hydrogenedentota bacterium]
MTVLAIVSLIHGATVFNSAFDRANAAFLEDDFQTAIKGYEQLVSDGVADADLFYNLGNAYYRAGRLGPAIANYERALHLRPDFESADRNLAQCLGETQRQLSAPLPPPWQQALLFWHSGLTPKASLVVALACWILVWALLAIRLKWRRPYLRRAAVISAVVAVMFGLSSWVKEHPPLLAVANNDNVPVRYGIGPDETLRFELFAGDRVVVERRADGWIRVATAGGERGWVEEDELTLVGPPYSRPPDASADREEGRS